MDKSRTRGIIVKTFALTAAFALAIGAAAPAGAIEVLTNTRAVQSTQLVRQPDLAPVPLKGMLPTAQLSELPEPEVFAMMLLGLVLIGYRASRDSSEKFK
jgi:hypothetical protein